MSQTYTPSETQWKHARRVAFVQDVLAAFTQRPADLLPFEEVRQKLQLSNVHYLGLQDVPLDHIVGSVGRYQDFTRAFFPRWDDLQNRWLRIQRLVTTGADLPPVELYKVGQVYFVRDGNHRVSVARQRNFPTIGAYVWECETHVPLEPDTANIDDLLCRTAHAAFLERTNIDRLCPDLRVELTQPDAYADLLYEIEGFQQILSRIDEQEVPFNEALALWGEMRYPPIVEIIRQRNILQEFPGRTEADLYLWLCRNQKELSVRYEHQVLMEEAADNLAKRFREKLSPARLVRKAVGRMAKGGGQLGDRLVRASRRALKRLQDSGDS